MSAEAVQAEILEPMQRLFLPPRQMDATTQAQALRDYLGALEHFNAPDLKTAWANVRDSHPTRSWPVPAVFVAAARMARKDRGGDSPAPRAPDTTTNERWTTWEAVRRSPLAYEAVKMGCAWSLKCAVLNDGKKPGEISLVDLRNGVARAERTAERIRRGQPHEWKGRKIGVFSEDNASVALKMWATLRQRETETQNEIAGR